MLASCCFWYEFGYIQLSYIFYEPNLSSMKQTAVLKLQTIFLITCWIATTALFAQQNQNENQTHPVVSLVEVQLVHEAELEGLLLHGFDVRYVSTDNTLATIVAMEHELQRLREHDYSFEIVHKDLTAYLQTRLVTPKETSLQIGQGSLGGFFNYDEIIAFIDSLHAEYPSIMSEPMVIGQTYQERNILAYKITSGLNDDADLPRTLITGMHHSNEPMSFIAPLYFTQWLLENYGEDQLATYMVDHREIWFVPVVNIDGYIHNETVVPGGGGLWRKNMRDNNENGEFNHWYDGVDLNRNYGYGWGFNNTGSQSYPGSPVYRGTHAFSESETQAIRDLCINKGFRTALNFHSFSNLLIHPTEPDGFLFPDMDIFMEYMHDMTKGNGYVFGHSLQTVNYTVNGDHDSWMHGEQGVKDKIIVFTPEIGSRIDMFWPSSDRIIPLAEENLYMQQYMVMAAGIYLKPEDHRFDDTDGGNGNMEAEAGETVDLIFSIRNKGYITDSEDVNVEISCVDEFVSIHTDHVVSDIAALTTEEVSFNISLSEDMPSGHTVTMTLLFTCPQGYIASELYEITFGMPQLLFFDNALDGMDQWEVNGKWGVTDERTSDRQLCFNDSPYGYYESSTEVAMAMSDPLDLSNMNNAFLTFNTRYHLERDIDLAQLQISTDHGQSWESLPGEYSTKGAGGTGMQPLGEPVYNGFRDILWVRERACLVPYLGENVLVRFYMASDHRNEAEGWFIDDIRVIGYSDETSQPEIMYLTKLPNTATSGPFPIEALVSVTQGKPDVSLFYSTNNVDYQALVMQLSDRFLYQSEIPEMALGDTVYYYVEVADDMQNSISSGIKSFVITDEPAKLLVCTDEITASLPMGETDERVISISNDGLLPLDWSLGWERLVILDPEGDQTGDSPDIIAIYADITSNNEFFFKIKFADEIDPETFNAYLLLDTDQDPETGWTGEELFEYSGWEIGAEYVIVFDHGNIWGQGSWAFLLRPSTNTPYGFRRIDVDGNTMSVKYPRYFFSDDEVIHLAAYAECDDGFDAAPDEGCGIIEQPGIAEWLDHDLKWGTVHAGESVDVHVEINSKNVMPGTYETELMIKSSDPVQPVYPIPVLLNVLSDQASILSFVFDEQIGETEINDQTNTIDVLVEANADLSALVAHFALSEGATANVDGVTQVSGTTANDFIGPVVYTVVAEDGNNHSDWTVTVSKELSSPDLAKRKFSIHPNPTDGLFTLELNDYQAAEKLNLEIYGAYGNVVMRKELPGQSRHLLDLTGNHAGIYLIRIVVDEETYVKRLIKK